MPTAKRTPRKTKERRGQGRPVAGENDVGKERLVAAAEKLLRELPPSRVTIARIAAEANVDPALVRYYFGNRAALLIAVVDRLTRNELHTADLTAPPDIALADHIRRTLRFTRSAPFMHRLIIEELADVGTDDSRARTRAKNLALVSFYRRVMKADAGESLRNVNPVFLHLLVLGIGDFFASADPLIRELVPSNTDMDRFAAGFQDFAVELILEGLRKR